jgi:hypothetical protein
MSVFASYGIFNFLALLPFCTLRGQAFGAAEKFCTPELRSGPRAAFLLPEKIFGVLLAARAEAEIRPTVQPIALPLRP